MFYIPFLGLFFAVPSYSVGLGTYNCHFFYHCIILSSFASKVISNLEASVRVYTCENVFSSQSSSVGLNILTVYTA